MDAVIVELINLKIAEVRRDLFAYVDEIRGANIRDEILAEVDIRISGAVERAIAAATIAEAAAENAALAAEAAEDAGENAGEEVSEEVANEVEERLPAALEAQNDEAPRAKGPWYERKVFGG